MGQHWSDLYRAATDPPGVNPGPAAPIKHDQLEGFEDGRKERVMIATKEEMDAWNIPANKRDFCAHEYINFKACHSDGHFTRHNVMFFALKCRNEYHGWEHCKHEDRVIRMKEFERQRRLNFREYTRNLKAEKEAKRQAAEEMDED